MSLVTEEKKDENELVLQIKPLNWIVSTVICKKISLKLKLIHF